MATTGMGAAYGTAKSGIGIAGVGIYRPDLIMKVRIWVARLSTPRVIPLLTAFAVPHPRGHVGYHRRIRPRHLGLDRTGPAAAEHGEELQFV